MFGCNVKTEDFERYLIKYYKWDNKQFPWKQEDHEPSLSV
jgi:hypothetical protein